MDRPLSGFEKALHYTTKNRPFSLTARLRLRPAPDPEALLASFSNLQRRHPPLRARIVEDPKPRFHHLDHAPSVPLTTENAGHEESWRERVESYLGSSSEPTQAPLIAVHLLNGPEGAWADLTLQAHHAVLDGSSLAWLLDELLTDLAGENLAGTDQPPSPDAVERFPRPYRPPLAYLPLAAYAARQMGQELIYQLKTRNLPKPQVRTPARSRTLTRRLDRPTTERLVRACRQRRLSLNNTLGAAQLLAVWQDRYHSQPRPLQTIAFADLRRYLDPPVPPAQLGAYLSMLRLTVDLEEEQGLWPMAESIQQQLTRAFDRGEKYLAALASEMVMRMMLAQQANRMAASALSYLGPLPLQERYGEFQIEAVNGFISNLAVGPEFTSMVYLWRGQLHFNFVHLAADMSPTEAGQLADRTLSLLTEAAG